MIQDNGFDLVRNEFPKCPHCGVDTCDYGDIQFDSNDMALTDCWHCEKEYRVWRVVDVSYSTEKTSV